MRPLPGALWMIPNHGGEEDAPSQEPLLTVAAQLGQLFPPRCSRGAPAPAGPELGSCSFPGWGGGASTWPLCGKRS